MWQFRGERRRIRTPLTYRRVIHQAVETFVITAQTPGFEWGFCFPSWRVLVPRADVPKERCSLPSVKLEKDPLWKGLGWHHPQPPSLTEPFQQRGHLEGEDPESDSLRSLHSRVFRGPQTWLWSSQSFSSTSWLNIVMLVGPTQG